MGRNANNAKVVGDFQQYNQREILIQERKSVK